MSHHLCNITAKITPSVTYWICLPSETIVLRASSSTPPTSLHFLFRLRRNSKAKSRHAIIISLIITQKGGPR
jgi:hypothetical protein